MLGGTVGMFLGLGVEEAGDFVDGLEGVGEEEILAWAGGSEDHLFVRCRGGHVNLKFMFK